MKENVFSDRIWMHAWRLREKLSDLNLVVAPGLIIIDGRRCFITGGPSAAEVREPNLRFASGDRIAIDGVPDVPVPN